MKFHLLLLKCIVSANVEIGAKDEIFLGRTGTKSGRGVTDLIGGYSLRRNPKNREGTLLRRLPGRHGDDRKHPGRNPVFRRRGQIGGTASRGARSGQPALALPGE